MGVAPKGFKRAEVRVPDLEGVLYRASCENTGEVFECSDLAPILRRMSEGMEFDMRLMEKEHAEWKVEVLRAQP